MTDQRNHYKAAVAIDLGARATGLFTAVHPADRFPTAEDAYAAAILTPDEVNFKFSQKERTMRRHARRGFRRRDMVRRLAKLIFDDLFAKTGVTMNEKETNNFWEALRELFKRRGYSFLESKSEGFDVDLGDFDGAPLAKIEGLKTYFKDGEMLDDTWDLLVQDPPAAARLLTYLPTAREFKKVFLAANPDAKDVVSDYKEAVDLLREMLKEFVRAKQTGNRSRKEYFKAIRTDIGRDSRFVPGFKACGSAERFINLVSNLSNLQLRACRWYFDDITFFGGDKWRPERLKAVLKRYFLYFEAGDKADRLRINTLLKMLAAAPDAVEFFATTDPELTIPPYDRMFNRHPPKDQTLLLSPVVVKARVGEVWTSWVSRLQRAFPELTAGLADIEPMIDRASRLMEEKLPDSDYTKARFLQRVLDRNVRQDPFKLRSLARGEIGARMQTAQNELIRVLGRQHLESFLSLASDYYAETEAARSGLWDAGEGKLLERADIHPKMKKKVINVLVANLFGFTGADSESDAEYFRTICWHRRIGRRSLKSICEGIEKTRKAHGNEFNLEYQRALTAIESGAALTDDQKTLIKVHDDVETVRSFLTSELKMSDDYVFRVCNPFSLAQLYTLIETERSGFTKTTMAAHLENQYRMEGAGTEAGALCNRLPADCVRPFDGMLDRILDRQAWEVAKIVFKELKAKVKAKHTDIDVSFLIEENAFAFSADLYALKGNLAKKKNAETQKDRQEKRWLQKSDRIAAAGAGICPIVGRPLEDDEGVTIHLIPRRQTMEWMGTIYNSEANLIRVSPEGAKRGAGQRLTLDLLADNYLKGVFGTADRGVIADTIEAGVRRLAKQKRLGMFELLNQDDQAMVRHALCLYDGSLARTMVIHQLGTFSKTLVNGTQPWLIRLLMRKLEQIARPWCESTGNRFVMNAWRVSPQDVSDVRRAVSEAEETWAKGEGEESLPSQAIDALCAYAAAAGNPKVCEALGASPDVSDFETYRKQRTLQSLYPDECDIVRIARRAVTDKTDPAARSFFLAGIYAEHFLPILTYGDEVRLGYSQSKNEAGNNSIAVTGDAAAFMADMAAFLETPYVPGVKAPKTYMINHRKAFEFFNRLARNKSEATKEDWRIAAVLSALHYTTKRQSLKDTIIANAGDEKLAVYKKREDVEVNTTVNVKYTGRGVKYKFAGTVELPCRNEWYRFINAPELTDKWGQKLAKVENFDIDVFLKRFAQIKDRAKEHVSCRTMVSLPAVAAPSGGIRLERRTYPDKAPVYHMMASDGQVTMGFEVKNGKICWDTPVIRRELVSEHLTPKDYTTKSEADVEAVARLDEYRTLYETQALSLAMMPATKARPKIRIRMPFEQFKAWLSAQKLKKCVVPETPLNLIGEYKAEGKWSGVETVFAGVEPLVGTCRKPIKVEACGTMVTIVLEPDTRTGAMKEAYKRR